MFIKNSKNEILAYFDGNFLLDNKKRKLLTFQGKYTVVHRYINMTEDQKKIIAKLYEDLTGDTQEKTLSFLNFEDEAFCS